MSDPPIVSRAHAHSDAIALRTGAREYSYRELLGQSASVARTLLDDAEDLHEARVAFLLPAGFEYTATQWGIWRAGGMAVPLSLSATVPELEYAISDSESGYVVVSRVYADRVREICQRLHQRLIAAEDIEPRADVELPLPSLSPSRRAMILYTSGTTSKPKGVVSTHANIEAQIKSLVEAWKWQPEDSIPLFLPLHHIHGIINVMSCALWTGATIETFAQFDMKAILDRVADRSYSVFMAVPTIYVKMIQALDAMPDGDRARVVSGFAQMRLMISGSAALPASVHEAWTRLTGQKLLERYGMTEIGMALSNPYDGERMPGMVGQPLPGVELRLHSEAGQPVTEDGKPGEIQVRGPAVFTEYWNRDEATAASFDGGWFRTGDIAVRENGYYRIMGRQSVDIIKSGGYKLSALEIEAVLLEHESIRECAIVGVPDDTWGEAVAAAIVVHEDDRIDPEELRAWCRERMSKYKIPKRLAVVDALPRNAMGKVTKPAVSKLF